MAPAPPHPHPNKTNRKFSCLILYFNLAIVYHIAFINCATSWKTNRAYILNPLRPAHQVKAQSRVCHATNVRFFFLHRFQSTHRTQSIENPRSVLKLINVG